MTYTIPSAPSTTTASIPSVAIANSPVAPTPALETRLQAAVEHARRLTTMRGTADTEVAIAWETVGELQVSLYSRKPAAKTSFAQYCEANPDAPECRIYGD